MYNTRMKRYRISCGINEVFCNLAFITSVLEQVGVCAWGVT